MILPCYLRDSRCLSLVVSITLLVCDGVAISWLYWLSWSWALRTRSVSTAGGACVGLRRHGGSGSCVGCVCVRCAGALCGVLEGGLLLCSRHTPKSSPTSCAKTSAGVHPLPSQCNNKSTHGSIDYLRHGGASYDAPLSPHVNT
jgi:hypothetical protein